MGHRQDLPYEDTPYGMDTHAHPSERQFIDDMTAGMDEVGVPPLVLAARRDQALIDATSADNECVHGNLPADGVDCGCWEDRSVAVFRLHEEGLRPYIIAERTGVPYDTVRQWVRGIRVPRVPLAPFRERFERMDDDAARVIALRLGWFRCGYADADRVRRTLGVSPTPGSVKNGKPYPSAHRQRIQRRTAQQLCEAMGMDPTDVGL